MFDNTLTHLHSFGTDFYPKWLTSTQMIPSLSFIWINIPQDCKLVNKPPLRNSCEVCTFYMTSSDVKFCFKIHFNYSIKDVWFYPRLRVSPPVNTLASGLFLKISLLRKWSWCPEKDSLLPFPRRFTCPLDHILDLSKCFETVRKCIRGVFQWSVSTCICQIFQAWISFWYLNLNNFAGHAK